MIRRRIARLHELEEDLPGAVRFGRRLTYGALLLAVCALVGVGLLASSKADRADARSVATAQQQALVVCALTHAQRSGNPARPAATTDTGQYVGDVWQAAYRAFRCARYSDAELDAVIRPGATTTLSPLPTPGG